MLVPFGLDPTAIAYDTNNPASSLAEHERFLELWAEVGILIYSPETGMAEIVAAVDRLPIAARSRWKVQMTLLRHASMQRRGKSLSQAESPADLFGYVPPAKVICVSSSRAGRLGLPPDEQAQILDSPSVELSRFGVADRARAFQAARRLAHSEIPKGMSTEEVWKKWFAPIHEWTRQAVVVVDRYCVSAALSCPRRYRSGLAHVIHRVATGSVPLALSIYVSDAHSTVAEIRRLLVGAMPHGRSKIRSLTAYIVEDRKFGEVVHHRYLRFDRAVAGLDTGLEPLAREKVWRTCQVSVRSYQMAMDTECELRNIGHEFVFSVSAQ